MPPVDSKETDSVEQGWVREIMQRCHVNDPGLQAGA